jgi:D-alanine-D-alanine ligase-like ATP-grasp enzyme
MTETSLVPMAAQAAGRSLGELCDGVINSALSR